MAQEAKVPAGFFKTVQKMIDDSIARYARSGPLRNAAISEGGLTIKDGGALRLSTADGVAAFYVGPVNPPLPDGSPQPGWIVRRNDGTAVLVLRDTRPDLDGYSQFLGWYDRTGQAIFTDDTTSGFGIARPHLAHAFYPSRYGDFLKTTNAAFETLWRARVEKQQPQLHVEAWGTTDTAGTTGEVRVMVNGVQLDATQTATSSVVNGYVFGSSPVAGSFGDILDVEIQARRTAGTGSVQVGAKFVSGWQS